MPSKAPSQRHHRFGWVGRGHGRRRTTYLCGGEAAERVELGDGDGHLGLVVGVAVRGRAQRVQRRGEVLVRVRLDRQRLRHRQHLHVAAGGAAQRTRKKCSFYEGAREEGRRRDVDGP